MPVLKRAVNELNAESEVVKSATDEALEFLASCAGGDVRHALTLLEGAYIASDNIELFIEKFYELNTIKNKGEAN